MLRYGPIFCNCFLHLRQNYPLATGLLLFSKRNFYRLPVHGYQYPTAERIMIRAGVLSDTHLQRPDSLFTRQAQDCFRTCEVIIHAGDLTALPVLEAFSGKTVYAVCGNMCDHMVRDRHPAQMLFTLGRFTIGLTHGAGLGHNIEDALWALFPEADCMIYGHTHRPVCHRFGTTLFLNPGSFQATGRYGAPGTFAILEVGDELSAQIFERPQTP